MAAAAGRTQTAIVTDSSSGANLGNIVFNSGSGGENGYFSMERGGANV